MHFYWSFRGGTGDVERFLGRHSSLSASHPGLGSQFDDSAEIALEVAVEGPRDESAVAAQPAVPGGVLQLTTFSRECARIWRAVFGARFAYQPRKDIGRLSGQARRYIQACEGATQSRCAAAAGSGGAGPERPGINVEATDCLWISAPRHRFKRGPSAQAREVYEKLPKTYAGGQGGESQVPCVDWLPGCAEVAPKS